MKTGRPTSLPAVVDALQNAGTAGVSQSTLLRIYGGTAASLRQSFVRLRQDGTEVSCVRSASGSTFYLGPRADSIKAGTVWRKQARPMVLAWLDAQPEGAHTQVIAEAVAETLPGPTISMSTLLSQMAQDGQIAAIIDPGPYKQSRRRYFALRHKPADGAAMPSTLRKVCDALKAAGPAGVACDDLVAVYGNKYQSLRQAMTRIRKSGADIGCRRFKGGCRYFWGQPPKDFGAKPREPRVTYRDTARPLIVEFLNARPEGADIETIFSGLNCPVPGKPPSLRMLMLTMCNAGEVASITPEKSLRKMYYAPQHKPAEVPRAVRATKGTKAREPNNPPVAFQAHIPTAHRAPRSQVIEAIIPANVKRTIAPAFVDRRFAVEIPPGGGAITRDWRERHLAVMGR